MPGQPGLAAARPTTRGSPIAAVVLTGAEIDQTAGPADAARTPAFTLFATAATLRRSPHNPMFGVLAPDVVTRDAVVPGPAAFRCRAASRRNCSPFPAKCALYLEGDDPALTAESGANVGVEIVSGSRRLAYVPGAAAITPACVQRLARADVVMFDGTLFTDDEMIATGTGSKTGRRMGHMPLDGADGSLAALAGLRGRRIFDAHQQHQSDPDRRLARTAHVEAAGWEVAEDGMEIVL